MYFFIIWKIWLIPRWNTSHLSIEIPKEYQLLRLERNQLILLITDSRANYLQLRKKRWHKLVLMHESRRWLWWCSHTMSLVGHRSRDLSYGSSSSPPKFIITTIWDATPFLKAPFCRNGRRDPCHNKFLPWVQKLLRWTGWHGYSWNERSIAS
jgi:hypothetical protein